MRFEKHLELQTIIFLRFRKQNAGDIAYKYMGMKHIAKFVNRSYSYVAAKCKEYERGSMI